MARESDIVPLAGALLAAGLGTLNAVPTPQDLAVIEAAAPKRAATSEGYAPVQPAMPGRKR